MVELGCPQQPLCIHNGEVEVGVVASPEGGEFEWSATGGTLSHSGGRAATVSISQTGPVNVSVTRTLGDCSASDDCTFHAAKHEDVQFTLQGCPPGGVVAATTAGATYVTLAAEVYPTGGGYEWTLLEGNVSFFTSEAYPQYATVFTLDHVTSARRVRVACTYNVGSCRFRRECAFWILPGEGSSCWVIITGAPETPVQLRDDAQTEVSLSTSAWPPEGASFWYATCQPFAAAGPGVILRPTEASRAAVICTYSVGNCATLANTWVDFVKFNLTVDSNNDGVITSDDDLGERQIPGRILLVNDDDDNANGVPDGEDIPGFADDELVLARIDVATPMALPIGDARWRLRIPPGVRAYAAPDRTGQFDEEERAWPPPSSIYLEALVPSALSGDRDITIEATIGGALLTDSARATALALRIEPPGDLPVDVESALVGAYFEPFFEPDLTDVVQGRSIAFQAFRDGVPTSAGTLTIDDGAALLEVPLSSSSGHEYHARFAFLGAERSSEAFASLPGAPHSILLQSQETSVVADGHGLTTVVAYVADQFGNQVEDGTPVSFSVHDASANVDVASSATETTLGMAVASLRNPQNVHVLPGAPADTSLPMGVQAVAGSAATMLPLGVHQTSASLTPSPHTVALDIPTAASTTVTLTTDAADGTPVFWTISNGRTRTYPGVGQASIVSQGQASLTLSAEDDPDGLTRVGECVVTATVGDSLAWTIVNFVDSREFYLEIERPAICGDRLSDGVAEVPFAQVQAIPNHTLVVPPGVRYVPYYAESDVVIHGAPNTTYQVELLTTKQGPFIVLDGLTLASEITTNAQGLATFTLRNTAATMAGPLLERVQLVVREANPALLLLGQAEERVAVIPRVRHDAWDYTLDGLLSFFGGDPQTAVGVSAQVAGGMFIVSDIGTFVKNLWRTAGFSDKPPDNLEMILAGLGLASELAVGVGEIADVAISAAKAVVAFVGRNPFVDAMVTALKKVIAEGGDLASLRQMLLLMVSGVENLQVTKLVLNSKEHFDQLRHAVAAFGDQVGDAFMRRIHAIGSDINLGGIVGSQRVITLMGNLPPAVLAALKNSPKFDEAVSNAAHAIARGLDDELLTKILANPSIPFSANYGPAELLIDLGRVAPPVGATEEALKGYRSVADRLRYDNPSVTKGALYEIVVARSLREQGDNLDHFFHGQVKHVDPAGALQKTDLDVVMHNPNTGIYTIVQAKATPGAFKLGREQEWIEKAKREAALRFPNGNYRIVYQTSNTQAVPSRIRAYIERELAHPSGVSPFLNDIPYPIP